MSKINSAVHMRQEQEKLFSVVAKLETYTPVEPVNEEAEKVGYKIFLNILSESWSLIVSIPLIKIQENS